MIFLEIKQPTTLVESEAIIIMEKSMEKINKIQKVISNNINNIIAINNKYKTLGYEIYLDGNLLEVIYNNKTYKIKITSYNQTYYWHLEPYQNSYYETKVDNTINSLDMVLFAINEEIHEEEKNNNDKI